MKKSRLLAIPLGLCLLVGCTEADRVSHNLSQEADNFNDVRQITVMNCLKGEVLFQMTGKMSIYFDTEELAKKAINEIGEERLKKYVFRVEE